MSTITFHEPTRAPADAAFWYRVTDARCAPSCDEYGDPYGAGRSYIRTAAYRVLRETPKGVWLDTGWNAGRFVLRDARKRWACPTKEEALESFLARKRRQQGILEAQLGHVEEVIALAEREGAPALPTEEAW